MDIGDIIYFVFIALGIVLSFYNKKKNKNNSESASEFDAIANFFSSNKNESAPIPTESFAQTAPKMPQKSPFIKKTKTIKTPTSIEYTPRRTVLKSKIQRREIAAMEVESIENVQNTHENVGRIVDAKRMIIYSEIMNRPNWDTV